MIYLDSAATSLQKPPEVKRAVLKALDTAASPGRGGHVPAMNAAEIVYNCRTAAAGLFALNDPEQVVFTMNATHALNIAINSLVKPGTKVLISGFEHNSVTRPLHAIGAEIKVAGRKLFDIDDLFSDFEAQADWADVIICTHVSNVFGFILPIYRISELCKKKNKPLIIDASQSAGHLELDCSRLQADFVCMPGHKGLYGPQGTGLLLCGQAGTPLLHGGSGSDSILQTMPKYLPDRHEAGTHNVPGIAGLLEGIRFVQRNGVQRISAHEQRLLRTIKNRLGGREDLELFCTDKVIQSGVISLRSKAKDCSDIAASLNRKGVYVRSGLHCAPLAHESAGTLNTGTVRFSFSPFTSEKDVIGACDILLDILNISK